MSTVNPKNPTAEQVKKMALIHDVQKRYQAAIEPGEFVLVWSPEVGSPLLPMGEDLAEKLKTGIVKPSDLLPAMGLMLAFLNQNYLQLRQLIEAPAPDPIIQKPIIVQ